MAARRGRKKKIRCGVWVGEGKREMVSKRSVGEVHKQNRILIAHEQNPYLIKNKRNNGTIAVQRSSTRIITLLPTVPQHLLVLMRFFLCCWCLFCLIPRRRSLPPRCTPSSSSLSALSALSRWCFWRVRAMLTRPSPLPSPDTICHHHQHHQN